MARIGDEDGDDVQTDTDPRHAASERSPVDVIVEEFVRRHRRGEAPSVEEYAARHPGLADELRRTLPAAMMLERLKPGGASLNASGSRGVVDEPALPARLGDYQILREVGRGGMGVVYEAEQIPLRRRVALKVLADARGIDPTLLRRFEREARAAARLHHTNIVPVFGVGQESGVHYYVMQFIHGQGLDAVIVELRRLQTHGDPSAASDVAHSLLTGHTPAAAGDPAPAPAGNGDHGEGAKSDVTRIAARGQPYWSGVARIGVQAADALQHAHETGILHRDVKPSNLMLDTRGRLWVSDFGLAKFDDDADAVNGVRRDLTRRTDVIGTLRYMAPERLNGKCDGRSDVYALGLVLYELLTLRPAHKAASRHELIEQIARHPPTPPRRIDARVPSDLETIVLKAVACRPDDRYATARELAADLRRYLEDRPILARRVSRTERLRRWCRRNPTSAALAACVAGLLLAAAIGSAVAAARFRGVAGREAKARGEADDARQVAVATLAELYPANAAAADRRGDDAEAALWFANAATLAAPDDDQAGRHAAKAALWTRNAVVPVAAFNAPGDGAGGRVAELTFHPDERRLAVRSAPAGAVTLWDLARGEQLQAPPTTIHTVTAAPPSCRIELAAAGDKANVHDNRTGTLLASVPIGGSGPPSAVALSPDGMTLLVAGPDGGDLWSTAGGGTRLTPGLHALAGVYAAAFSPGGRHFATAGPGTLVRVWALPAGPLPAFRIPVAGRFATARFDRSGRFVMAGGLSTNIATLASTQVYDAETGAAAGPVIHPGAGASLRGADFSPDGARIATTAALADEDSAAGADAYEMQYWDWRSGERLGGAVALPSDPLDVEYDPAGARAAVWCAGGEVLLVDADDGTVLRRWQSAAPPGRDARWVVADGGLCWSPDGRRVVTWGGAAAEVWDADSGRPSYAPLRHDGLCCAAQFSARGDYIATAGWDGTARVWDAATGRPAAAPLVHHAAAFTVRFVAGGDDRHLLTDCADHSVRLWDWRDGRLVHPVSDEPFSLSTGSTPDGRRVIAGSAGGTVRVWDVRSRAAAAPAVPVTADPWAVAVAPGGRFAAAAGNANAIDVLRLDVLDAAGPSDPARALARSELVAGRRLERGRIVRLSATEWAQRWQICRAERPAFNPADVDTLAWHRRQADAAGRSGHDKAELFHLRVLSDAGAADWAQRARGAEICAAARRWQEAAAWLDGALRLNPGDARLHLRRGDALIAAGSPEPAGESFADARGLQNPDRSWVRGNWWFAGPYAGRLDDAFPPESQTDVSKPLDAPQGQSNAVTSSWRLYPADAPSFAFHDHFNWAEYVVGYAQTFIHSTRDQTVNLSLGSDDAVRVWLNGDQVFRHDGFLTPGTGRARVTLRAGFNRLLFKVANESRHHLLSVHLSDDVPQPGPHTP